MTKLEAIARGQECVARAAEAYAAHRRIWYDPDSGGESDKTEGAVLRGLWLQAAADWAKLAAELP